MNEEEKESIEEFRKQLRLAINIDDVTTVIRNDNAQTILNLIEKLQKENEELKEKENKIYKEVQESLAFEKFLIVKERKPDLFNQGRFYISQIIYDILNDVQNPEGIHKENKCIQYIDYIPIQKVKDDIEELKAQYKTALKENSTEAFILKCQITILQELIEGNEDKIKCMEYMI